MQNESNTADQSRRFGPRASEDRPHVKRLLPTIPPALASISEDFIHGEEKDETDEKVVEPVTVDERVLEERENSRNRSKYDKPELKDTLETCDGTYERRICESVVIEKEGFCPRGLLNPHWIGKLVWDFAVMFFVLMDAMVLPFQLTFKSNLQVDSFDIMWLWITTWIFAIDIVLTFNTAIESGEREGKGKLILDRVAIAKNYVRGWFLIDFGSAVPWAQISEAFVDDSQSQLTRLTKVVKFVRLLRLVRMLRLAKLGQIWERVEHRIGSVYIIQCISLLRVLSVVVAMCHWSACIFWLIGLPKNLFTELMSDEEQKAFKREKTMNKT